MAAPLIWAGLGIAGVLGFKVVSDEVQDLAKYALVGGSLYIAAKYMKVI